MGEEPDTVRRYGLALGWDLRYRTVLVEGTTDAALLTLAAYLEHQATGVDFLGGELAIIAAGTGDRGGTQGVIRELVCLRGYARTCLGRNGRPLYRFIGLFDNDRAGRQAVNAAKSLDTSIIEYKDVFRIHPVMPTTGNLDPKTLQKAFERHNDNYKGLDWELEDLLPGDFLDAFATDYPFAVTRTMRVHDMTHREMTQDGKAQLHQFVKHHALRADLAAVIELLKALRFYMGLAAVTPKTADTRMPESD